MRLNQDRQKKLEPIRLLKAQQSIEKLGYTVFIDGNNRVSFEFKGEKIIYWVYSGWASGKSIKDGRGLQYLLKQIINTKNH